MSLSRRRSRVDFGEGQQPFSTGLDVDSGENAVDFGERDFLINQLLRVGYPVDFGEHANNRIKYSS
jgi:hypothetical protein